MGADNWTSRVFHNTGNRSSADESRPDSPGPEDETVVEPEQGNGECCFR